MTTEAESATPAERLPQIFEAFATHGAPSATGATSYGFRLTGDGGGDYVLNLSPEKVSWDPVPAGGEISAPVTVTLSVGDLVQIVDGSIDGRFAVSSERIEIEGDFDLAAGMFDLVQAAVQPDTDDEAAQEEAAESAPEASEPAAETSEKG